MDVPYILPREREGYESRKNFPIRRAESWLLNADCVFVGGEVRGQIVATT